MDSEKQQRDWVRLVAATAAGKSDVAAAMRKLIRAARREDPDHPAWEHVGSLDFAGDANRVADGVRKVFDSRKLKAEHTRVAFELDPVNLGGDGGINVLAGEEGDVDLGVVRSRVLAKLYEWAEDGDAADVLVGLGFTAVAVARALRSLKSPKARRVAIAYHDSLIDPLVLGDVTPRGFVPAKQKAKVPETTPVKAKPRPTPSQPKSIKVDNASSPTQWLLRASKYGGGAVDASMKAALKSLEAGDTAMAKTALAAAMKPPGRTQYDEKLAYVGALYFVAQRLGDAAKVKQATQLYARVIKSLQADPEYFVYAGPRAAHAFERYKRGIENDRYWMLSSDEIPLEVWVPFLDAIRARRDNDVPRCRAALKQLDAAVGRALAQRGMREKLLKIGGEYAIAHGFCGNVTRVREVLKKFKGPFDGPKPEQAFEALFLAGDRKGAAAVATRELNQRLREVTGKAGPVAAMNAHHSLSELEDIFQAQLEAGDRAGVARALDAVGKALGGKSRSHTETRAWALKTVADMEMRIGRPDRARDANALAEKLAAKVRGAEVRSMSWRGVAEVYSKLGEWEQAQAAIAKIPSRHEKLGATVHMLVHRGDMDQVAREIGKMKGNEAKRRACEFVAEVLEEAAVGAEPPVLRTRR